MSRCSEMAFLPAALETQETPPSPIGRAIIWTILAFFTLSIVWAVLSEVDIVSVSRGRIIPSGHSKTVQSLEIGTVGAIHVSEGQRVEAGDVLIELDPSAVRADVDRLKSELEDAGREIARYRQLAAWSGGAEGRPGEGQRLASMDTLLLGQWHEFTDRLAVLESEQDRQRVEQQSAQQQVAKLKAVLSIVARKAKNHKGLAAQKLLPEQHYLETEQGRLEVLHDLRSQQGHVAELEAGIRELDARIAFTRSEFRRQVLERREEAVRRQTVTRQELIKAETRARAHIVSAPVDGVVQQLAVHNLGAVVTPAQELMVIVPQDGVLEVEAVLENKDIGFVAVGQSVEIKVDTFPFTKYGTIAGHVVDLSDDAVADNREGLVYKMRVAMESARVNVNGKQVRLSPGMSVTVESKTGTRRLIEFFLSPLLRYANESTRER